MIMKIIDQCDVKYIMTLPIKTVTSVLNDSTYIINSTTSCSIKLNAILTIVYINLQSKKINATLTRSKRKKKTNGITKILSRHRSVCYTRPGFQS